MQRGIIVLSLVALAGALLPACQTSEANSAANPAASPTVTPVATTVVALGRIVPTGEVIKLSVPNAQDSRVNRILVKEGDRVEANQVIAVLQGADRRRADVQAAQTNIKLLQAQLAKAKQGNVKPASLDAQRAIIERLQAQQTSDRQERQAAIASAQAVLADAERTYARRQQLHAAGALEREKVDTAKRDVATTRATLQQRQAELTQTNTVLAAQIREEQAKLAELQQVLPVDVAIAQAQLEQAQVQLEQRRTDLEDTQVRVPIAGQILRINTRVGEQVNTQQGIVELAQTEQMYAIAEVYETEIRKIRHGQRATLTSEYGGFQGQVTGVVDHIGLKIGKRTLTDGSSDPTNDENTRVVEVKIRISPEDNPKVAKLTNLQVRIKITL